MKYLIVLFGVIIGVYSDCNPETTFTLKYTNSYTSENYTTVKGVTINSYVNDVNSKHVVLKRGDLGDFCADFIKPFNGKSWIDIQDFGISRLVKGVFKDGFDNLDRLAISHNYFSEVQDDVFTLAKLRSLTLKDNGIIVISNNAFKSLPSLEWLDLSHNRIWSIQPDWFQLSPLETINLDYNKITEIEDEAFSQLAITETCLTSDDSSDCPTISLIHNEITGVSADAFKGLKQLDLFDLGYNQLTQLPLINDVYLESINLEYNEITFVEEDVLDYNKEHVNITFLYGNALTTSSVINVNRYNKENGIRIFDNTDILIASAQLIKDEE